MASARHSDMPDQSDRRQARSVASHRSAGKPATSETANATELGDVYARRGLLVRLAYRFCWNIADAEDAVQNALLRAERKHGQLADRSKLWSWVRSIVVRQCHEVRRAAKRRDKACETLELAARNQAAAPSALADLQQSELADLVRTLIAELPERQQTALVLRHLENLSFEGIAEIMGISPSTARVHVHQGRESLKGKIVNRYPEWGLEG